MHRSPLHRSSATFLLLAAALLGACSMLPSQEGAASSEAFEQALAKLEHRPGLFDLYLDRKEGRAWLVLPAPDPEGVHATFLYAEGLAQGLGSNPVGLDRGQISGAWVVRLRSLGGKLLLEKVNTAFRARTDEKAEQDAVRESFASSVIWAADEVERAPDGRVRVEITSLVVRDAHGSAQALGAAGGSWHLDRERSVLDVEACRAFPDNLELAALLTFAGSGAGAEVRATAPDPEAVTLVQHHSFIRLPDDAYQPRRYDPRAGVFPLIFQDYAAPLTAPMEVRLARRQRLLKRDPHAARSEPIEPIVYYVDRGAPEPIRSALIEGASWWGEAFEKAGFDHAFRVELLPEGVDPLDIRYNVIQWVHRSTRGWSYGNGVTDPRTGEIIKGHVILGSKRVRQDRLLFEGLSGTAATGSGRADDPVELALARIRQLAAHEVGHTLGFAHNFTASTFGRASVMDYPAPLVTVKDGKLDFSQAYAVGIGAWDEIAVAWLYGVFSPDQEEEALEAILAEAADRGMRFHSDSDARPAGAAQPYANLWDNFADPVTGLENTLEVRAVALAHFGERNLSAGRPRAELEEVLAPLYFHHRYQVEAAVKMLGGVDYDHVRVGQGAPPAEPIPAAEQRRALEVLLGCLAPEVLDLPESILSLLGPRPPGIARNPEQFHGQSAPLFDPLAAAESAASLVIDGLLDPRRCARMVDQHRRHEELPSLEELLEALTDAAFGAEAEGERRAEITRLVEARVVYALIQLAEDERAPQRVASRAEGRLARLLEQGVFDQADDEAEHAHLQALRRAVVRHLSRRAPSDPGPLPAPQPPPGSPIGMGALCGCAASGE